MLKVVLADVPMAHLKGEAVTESPNLGILYIISYVRRRLKNVEFHYLEPLLSLEEHLAEVEKLKPDVYCTSITTQKKALGYETIQKVKQLVPNLLVMAGGAHPTVDPADVREQAEPVFLGLFQELRNEKNLSVEISRRGQSKTLSYEIR